MITVTYRSESHIGAAIQSVRIAAERARVSLQIIVVDNASPDGSVREVRAVAPDAVIIENPDNRGFGAACNQAFTIATGHYWLLLNPDAAIHVDALDRLASFLGATPGAGAVGARIVGGLQSHSENAGMAPDLRSLAAHFLFLNRVWPSGAWRGFYIVRDRADHPIRVEWCGAAAMLVRPEAIREVGGFDPTFFLYGEDVDLGIRMTAAGWGVWVDPTATAEHEMGASQPGISTRWVDGTLEVVERSSNRAKKRAAAGIMAAGLLARAVIATMDHTPEGRRHARTMYASAVRAMQHAMAAGSPTP